MNEELLKKIRNTQCPELAALLYGLFKPNDSVIDIGCGNKWYHPFLRCKLIVSVDVWKKTKPDILMDVSKHPLPLPDKRFSTCLMLDVIEHIPKERGAFVIEQAARVAKKVYLLTPLIWDDNAKSTEDSKSWYYHNKANYHKSLWSESDFKALGFNRIQFARTMRNYYFGELNGN